MLKIKTPQTLNYHNPAVTHTNAPSQDDNSQNTGLQQLYIALFGGEELKNKSRSFSQSHQTFQAQLLKEIKEQIVLLQQVEEEYQELMSVFSQNKAKMSSEDKWKAIVIAYKEKVKKLQLKVDQERRARILVQETLRYQEDEKQRLDHLNQTKLQKISDYEEQIQQLETQMLSMSRQISQLGQHVSLEQSKNNKLQNQLLQVSKANEELTSELKEQSIVLEREYEAVQNKAKILGDEEQQINKQVGDLKTKYEIEIARLQNSLSLSAIQKEHHLMLIDDLERALGFKPLSVREQSSQTETQTTKACFFNSLAEEIDDVFFEHGSGAKSLDDSDDYPDVDI